MANVRSFDPIPGILYSPLAGLEYSLATHNGLERDPPVPYDVLGGVLARVVLDRDQTGAREKLERAAQGTRRDGTDWELSRRLELLTAARLLNDEESFEQELNRAEAIADTARQAAGRMPARLQQYLNAKMALVALRSHWGDSEQSVSARRREPPVGEDLPVIALMGALTAKAEGKALPAPTTAGLSLLLISGGWTSESPYAAWACALLSGDMTLHGILEQARGALKPIEDECFTIGDDRAANFALGESQWKMIESGLEITIPVRADCKVSGAAEAIAFAIVHHLTLYLERMFDHQIPYPKIKRVRRRRDLEETLSAAGSMLTVRLTTSQENPIDPERLALASFLLDSLAQWMSVRHSLAFRGKFVATHEWSD